MIQHLAVQMRAAIAEHADRPATRIRVADDWCTPASSVSASTRRRRGC